MSTNLQKTSEFRNSPTGPSAEGPPADADSVRDLPTSFGGDGEPTPLDALPPHVRADSSRCGRSITLRAPHSYPAPSSTHPCGDPSSTGEMGGDRAARKHHANNSSGTPSAAQIRRRSKAQKQRRRRYRRRDTARKVTGLDRLRACGRYRAEKGQSVQVKIPGEGKHSCFRNVQTCGSPWVCPVCAAKVRQEYAQKIRELVMKHLAKGGGVMHWVGTMPHDGADRLADLFEVQQKAWEAISSGRLRQEVWERFGIEGYIRSLDVTVGPKHGWHPHYHVLLLTESPLTPAETEDLELTLYDVWRRKIKAGGYRTPHRTQCPVFAVEQDAHAEEAAHYLAMGPVQDPEVGDRPEPTPTRSADPSAIGLEMARHDLKTAGRGRGREHLNPFQVLDKIKEESSWDDPDEELLDWLSARWREYEDATKGKRSIQTSHRLWSQYDVGEDGGGDGDEEAEDAEWRNVPMEAWREMGRMPGAHHACLEAAEGLGAVKTDAEGFLVAVGTGEPCTLDRLLNLLCERYELRQWGLDPPDE